MKPWTPRRRQALEAAVLDAALTWYLNDGSDAAEEHDLEALDRAVCRLRETGVYADAYAQALMDRQPATVRPVGRKDRPAPVRRPEPHRPTPPTAPVGPTGRHTA